MIQLGVVQLPMVQDIAIDLSTLPQKELIKQRMNAYLRAQGLITADELIAAQAAGMVVDPSQIQQPAEPEGAQGKPKKPPEGGSVGPTAAPALPAPAAPAAAMGA